MMYRNSIRSKVLRFVLVVTIILDIPISLLSAPATVVDRNGNVLLVENMVSSATLDEHPKLCLPPEGHNSDEPHDKYRCFTATIHAQETQLYFPQPSIRLEEDMWDKDDPRRKLDKDPCPPDEENGMIDDDLFWFEKSFSNNYLDTRSHVVFSEDPLLLLLFWNGVSLAYGHYPEEKGPARWAICVGTEKLGPLQGLARSFIRSGVRLYNPGPLYSPTHLTADMNEDFPRLAWSFEQGDATKVVIHRSDARKFYEVTSAGTWTDYSAECGKQYTYWVAAANQYSQLGDPRDYEDYGGHLGYGSHSDWKGPVEGARQCNEDDLTPTPTPTSVARPETCNVSSTTPGVILYSQINYLGRCHLLFQSHPNLAEIGFGIDKVSSVRVNGKYRLRLFRGTDFSPLPYEEVNRNEPNLDIRSLGGQYLSIEIKEKSECENPDAPGVLLYEDKNYEGTCTYLRQSEPNLGNTRVGDNEASSIRINGEYTVKLYKDINYGGGPPEEVNKDDPDLDKRSLGGQYSSARIESPVHCDNENLPGVYLYSEKRHRGSCVHIIGDVADLDDTPVGNDGPRSLRIVGPYYVKMYKDRDFRGPSDEFGTNQDDLTWRSLGDQYSSVRFYEKNKPPVLFLSAANGTTITVNNQEVWSNAADWSFSGTASDSDGSVSRVEFNCDGDSCYERNRQVNGTSSWSYSRTGLTGYNRIYFFAYDNKNARSGERDRSSVHLYVDQSPPATTASLNGESNRERWPDWFTRPVQVRLDAQDGATGRARRGVAEVFYSLDSGPWQQVAGSSATFAVNGDGSHQVDFYAVDGVGNREATQSVTFQMDQTPPSPPGGVAETHDTPHDRWQRDVDTPTFTWNPSADATSGVWGYQFYFDTDPAGIGYQTFLTGDPLTWTPRPDGVRTATYYLRGRSRDVAGNWSVWTDLFTFRYDGTPPENPDAATHAAGVTNDSWQRATALADFTWAEPHDEGSGVNGYYAFWGLDPAGVADAYTTARAFQSNTPLCATDSACTGYLRLRSVDNVQNQAEEWSTVFALRYDNAPPTVDFTFNGGVTQTAQTQITLDIQAADLGSGVKEMRFSSDGQSWTEWEVHRPTRAWTIPGISRKDWPVYVQVRDGVGLESPVVMHRVYLDVNPQRPRSDNFRLYANFAGAGAKAQTSAPSNMQLHSTVGQATDTKPTGSANFTLLGGYQAGAGAIPLIEPGHDDFNFINGLFASGVYSDTLRSVNFRMVGSLGEVGLPNNRPAVSSSNFQLRPGFLAAEPVVKPLPAATPAPGPTPEPELAPACDFPTVSINNGASFTNQPAVLLSLCAPRAVEMIIASESSFTASTWEAYSASKAWTLPVDGKTVASRFVYVLFKDRDGTVHGTYIDDIIYDPNPPSGALAAGDSVPAAVALRSLRVRSAKADQYSFFQVGSTVYMQQLAGRSLSQPLAVLRARSDGSIDLFVDAQDDNSGLDQMQFGADTAALERAAWESYSALKPWTPAPEDGIQTVYARIKDDAGNVSDTSQVSFVVDTQAPVGGIAVARQVVGPDDTSLTIYLGAEDNLTGVTEMRLSQSSDFADAAWVPYTTLWTWSLDMAAYPTGGTLYVQYRDLAGNVSETYSDSFVIDAVAPLLYAEVSEGDSLTRAIQLHAYDELAGLGSVTLSNDPQMLTGTVTLAYTDSLTWTFEESQVAWVQMEDRVGNRTQPYPAYATLPYDAQSIPVAAGWNLNSFAVTPADLATTTVLQSIAGTYAWIQGDGTFFDPALGPEYNTLSELRPEAAYYIYTTAEEEVALVGTRIPVTTPIALQAGWNWIGYLPDTALPVEQALQSIAGKYQRILSITDSYESLLPENSYLTVLEPGQGYLIHMTEPATLVYPEVSAANAAAPTQASPLSRCNVAPTPLLTLVYGDVSINGQPAPVGARIEAMSSGGTIAGCFVVQKTGQFGLMHVYGGWDPTQSDETTSKEGEEILWRVNSVAAQSDVSLLWQSDLSPHRLNLATTMKPLYLPLIGSAAGQSSADRTSDNLDIYLPLTNR